MRAGILTVVLSRGVWSGQDCRIFDKLVVLEGRARGDRSEAARYAWRA
jgi:hypothetical protein